MGYEKRRKQNYYYRKRRVGDRVVSEYLGCGTDAEIAAKEDADRRKKRAAIRTERKQKNETMEAVRSLLARVQDMADVELITRGYHRHRGCWRWKMTNNEVIQTNPSGSEPTESESKEILKLADVLQRSLVLTWVAPEDQTTTIDELDELRRQLRREHPSALARIQIESVLSTWLLVRFAEQMVNNATKSKGTSTQTLRWAHEYYGRALNQHLRAAESLARTSRLMSRLDRIQVNLATAGGQQVNIASDAACP